MPHRSYYLPNPGRYRGILELRTALSYSSKRLPPDMIRMRLTPVSFASRRCNDGETRRLNKVLRLRPSREVTVDVKWGLYTAGRRRPPVVFGIP